MGKSNKFLQDVSKAARESNSIAFSKLKNMFSSDKKENEDEKERKRKELIEKERQRTYNSLKNKPY